MKLCFPIIRLLGLRSLGRRKSHGQQSRGTDRERAFAPPAIRRTAGEARGLVKSSRIFCNNSGNTAVYLLEKPLCPTKRLEIRMPLCN